MWIRRIVTGLLCDVSDGPILILLLMSYVLYADTLTVSVLTIAQNQFVVTFLPDKGSSMAGGRYFFLYIGPHIMYNYIKHTSTLTPIILTFSEWRTFGWQSVRLPVCPPWCWGLLGHCWIKNFAIDNNNCKAQREVLSESVWWHSELDIEAFISDIVKQVHYEANKQLLWLNHLGALALFMTLV